MLLQFLYRRTYACGFFYGLDLLVWFSLDLCFIHYEPIIRTPIHKSCVVFDVAACPVSLHFIYYLICVDNTLVVLLENFLLNCLVISVQLTAYRVNQCQTKHKLTARPITQWELNWRPLVLLHSAVYRLFYRDIFDKLLFTWLISVFWSYFIQDVSSNKSDRSSFSILQLK